MKCVRCGQVTNTAKCGVCGYDHASETVDFLIVPDPEAIHIPDPDFEIDGDVLVKYKGHAARIVVPAHVRKIAANVFSCNATVKQIVLPEGLTEIGDNAFEHCKELEQITFPNSMIHYGKGLFTDCWELKKVSICGNSRTVFDGAFCGSWLKEIEFRKGIEELNLWKLCDCKYLQKIKVAGSVRISNHDLEGRPRRPSGIIAVDAPILWLIRNWKFFTVNAYYFEPKNRLLLFSPATPQRTKIVRTVLAATALILLISIISQWFGTPEKPDTVAAEPVPGNMTDTSQTDAVESAPANTTAETSEADAAELELYNMIDKTNQIPSVFTHTKDGYVYEENGRKVVYKWREIDGNWYYFGGDGILSTGISFASEDHEGMGDDGYFGFDYRTGALLTGSVSESTLNGFQDDEENPVTYYFDQMGRHVYREQINTQLEEETSYNSIVDGYKVPTQGLPLLYDCIYLNCEANDVRMAGGTPDGKWWLYVSHPYEGGGWIREAEAHYDAAQRKVTAEVTWKNPTPMIGGYAFVYEDLPNEAKCTYQMNTIIVIQREYEEDILPLNIAGENAPSISQERAGCPEVTGNVLDMRHIELLSQGKSSCVITSILFLNSLDSAPGDAVDVSKDGNGSVCAWIQDGSILCIAGEGGVDAPEDCSRMFSWNASDNLQFKLSTIRFNNSFCTSNVTNMNAMFGDCVFLQELDLSGFDTSKVTDMEDMFRGCGYLRELDLSSFDTSGVSNMRGMFKNCTLLSGLNLRSFDTSHVIDMEGMFDGCGNLRELDLSGFDTSAVVNMRGMFRACGQLSGLDLQNLDTAHVLTMEEMFGGCTNLKELDLSGFDTSRVRNMNSMFRNCRSLASLDISSFNTANVTDMGSMFEGCGKLLDLDVSHFSVKEVSNYDCFMDEDRLINGKPWKKFFGFWSRLFM